MRCQKFLETMGVKKTILEFLSSVLLISCSQKYPDIQIDDEDVLGYVNVSMAVGTVSENFFEILHSSKTIDTSKFLNYKDIVYILNCQGFPDIEYFSALDEKLQCYLKVIRQYSDYECYPGICTENLSFIDDGEKQYTKLLKDSTLSDFNRELYTTQLEQLKKTKSDLIFKQEKNKQWVSFIKKKVENHSDISLSDSQIMQLTVLTREME